MRYADLKLHLIVLIWGFTGILGALIPMQALSIVWYRMLIASSGLMIWMMISKKRIAVEKAVAFRLLGIGGIIAVHWFTFFHAIKVSKVSVALVCMSSASLFTALLEPLLYKRKLLMYEVVFGFFIMAGLYLIFQLEPGYGSGIAYGLASAFFASLFTVLNGLMVKKQAANVITTYEMIGGFVSVSLFLLITGQIKMTLQLTDATTYILLFILGLVCTAYAFRVSIAIMKTLSPFTVAITVNLEPVYAILLALLIFGEKELMGAGFYSGVFLITAIIFTNTWIKNRKRSRKV